VLLILVIKIVEGFFVNIHDRENKYSTNLCNNRGKGLACFCFQVLRKQALYSNLIQK
jgi:hypothetical protein